MVNLKYIVLYVILMDEIEVIVFMVYCKCFKEVVVEKGIKLIFLFYMVKVFVVMFCDFLVFNIILDDVIEEFVYKYYFNVGIVVDIDYGLYVLVIKNVDKKFVF